MRKSNYGIYKDIKSISYLVRFWLCCLTIENVSIFSNKLIEYFIGQIISVYFLLMVICYLVVGRLSLKLGIEGSSGKAVLYFAIYVIAVFTLWIILRFLTALGVIPI